MKAAGTNTVGAALVFLPLLEGEPDLFAEACLTRGLCGRISGFARQRSAGERHIVERLRLPALLPLDRGVPLVPPRSPPERRPGLLPFT